ncbi:NAD(P)-binding protein [Cryphonectria parasitica EP155]|uniref:NAD(P)-binding protein n=1 Tax=Cryphonectria parasitica (strain ATCC 38755 / EP155) TaxID=660469 RepID=A0A9P5CWN9_CRYP1|nr:NAD(P)-binding protein [Cryphonectria parasitica EP155]KAF3771200.1 NAD(P)-binding protein [Cryphonectria parasitica EP155]
MDVNFFGLLDVTRKALEVMRDKNSPPGGLIRQVASIGGHKGTPTISIYCASKWAVEGFTESLSRELKPEWNIHVQLVEPGAFRTDATGRSMVFGEVENKAYDHLDARKTAAGRHGAEPGDTAKGATAMYELATMNEPPLRCVIGRDAYKAMEMKLEMYAENIKRFEELSTSTDVDE